MGWPKLDMEELNNLYVDLFMYLIEGMGFDIWTAKVQMGFILLTL